MKEKGKERTVQVGYEAEYPSGGLFQSRWADDVNYRREIIEALPHAYMVETRIDFVADLDISYRSQEVIEKFKQNYEDDWVITETPESRILTVKLSSSFPSKTSARSAVEEKIAEFSNKYFRHTSTLICLG